MVIIASNEQQGDSMAVESGKDYALAQKVTWVFKTGVGSAFGLVTKEKFYLFPYDTIQGAGSTVTTTKVSIGGLSPADAITQLLEDSSTTMDSLHSTLQGWADDVGKGPEIREMSEFKRIKLRNGFFNRNVAFSVKEKGIGLTGGVVAMRPKKAEMPAFYSLFEGDPRLV